jgi:hypothetical protein
MNTNNTEELADAIKIAVGEVVKARRVLAKHLSDLGHLLEQAGVRWDSGSPTNVAPAAEPLRE